MQQISQNYRTGEVRLETTCPPRLRAGGVLVRTRYSVVSAGTEGMKVREAKLSYLGKARARPDQVKRVLSTLRQQGLGATYHKVMNRLDKLTPLGYSIAGEVIAVGEHAEEFHVGQHVACAGAGYANHAEVNFIPRNLVVPVPQDMPLQHAAFATLGAIALQGFRQAELQLGESACVIGLGLLGQLLIQILQAAGMRVIGVDVLEERCRIARACGAIALQPGDPVLRATVDRITGGQGADAVFIVAGSDDNRPVELAVELARDRARLVDIGKTRLDLPWNACYLKELDVRFSRSYGPGRYDPVYEEQGVDYPVGYVRWTERRNMASFLDLVAAGRVRLDPLVSDIRPFAEAAQVYREIAEGRGGGLAIVFEYDVTRPAPARSVVTGASARRSVRPLASGVRIGFIGAGNYALTMLLPHMRGDATVQLDTVATATGLTASDAARKFGFRHTTTEYREILENPEIDAVVIATRHSSHARIAAEALRAGKAVYVEKPLALTLRELAQVRRAILDSGNDRLMVGFNRRFSPLIRAIAASFSGSAVPVVVHYRVHAGRLEAGSWYLDASEGSRFVGEGGHFLDTVAMIAGARPAVVYARSLLPEKTSADDRDNLSVIVQLANGSLGNIIYSTQGGAAMPKEYVEVFGGDRSAQILNFEASVWYEGDRVRKRRWRLDKGQKDQMASFIACVRAGSAMPVATETLIDSTLATLAVDVSLRAGASVELRELYQGMDLELQDESGT
jgi:predicted dehydrogenase/threonine dehydrogenase-like Zn-dependent dehydrogenase